jgi:hypothetical protein
VPTRLAGQTDAAAPPAGRRSSQTAAKVTKLGSSLTDIAKAQGSSADYFSAFISGAGILGPTVALYLWVQLNPELAQSLVGLGLNGVQAAVWTQTGAWYGQFALKQVEIARLTKETKDEFESLFPNAFRDDLCSRS